MLSRHISTTAIILSFFHFDCSQLGSLSNGTSSEQQLMQTLVLGVAAKEGCSIQSLTPISNTLSYVHPKRTRYDIQNCSPSDLEGLGFTGNTANLEKGLSGNSSDSFFSSLGNIVLPSSNGGTNLEVSFSLKSGGSLTAYAYGSGTPISGPAFRLTDSTKEQFYSEMSGNFEVVSKGTAALSTDTNYTYCIDFQYASSEQWINAWPKACSEVTQAERNSMMMFPVMQMMSVPAYSGNRVGFILNGAKLTSFTIGSILSQVD
ncbi:hypothetical protein EHQ81_01405 [Leptospira selangorensis]|uniref:Uncharacterized protein n=1 Tax=Leptospira selangorensis TaxID=2484982 RepID=A0A5F2BVZ3_9LEPT|nr:hypothetical protein [Leptospira selangorensis]TGM12062.1 hypothetical protein EHQ82_21210 [Leptospira selangorensis]TGM15077.1 hypothetical protein EHQ81_01405 [Leptospira selangorensis]